MSDIPSAASLLKQYVQRHPSIRDCLKRGLINHSSLAREVARTHRIKEIDALTMASSRYGSSLRGKPLPSESRYLTLLREARLHIQTRMLVAGVRRDRDYERPMALHALVNEAKRETYFY